jgi:hypothetical protein
MTTSEIWSCGAWADAVLIVTASGAATTTITSKEMPAPRTRRFVVAHRLTSLL